ncbi:MAG TPA: CHASE4 domain-containing protein, partial [Deltaproteobacteria bacterium]|nr:CHASE4 domain-containing protein [Deltaproteobacteria bacterium]
MSLKNKVVVILASIMVFSTLAYYGVFRHIVLRSFIELEDRLAERDMNRCVAALEREIKLLDGFVHDWSSWDDSYRFVQDRNGDYIKANLLWQVFKDQKLNFIHVYDAHGRLV